MSQKLRPVNEQGSRSQVKSGCALLANSYGTQCHQPTFNPVSTTQLKARGREEWKWKQKNRSSKSTVRLNQFRPVNVFICTVLSVIQRFFSVLSRITQHNKAYLVPWKALFPGNEMTHSRSTTRWICCTYCNISTLWRRVRCTLLTRVHVTRHLCSLLRWGDSMYKCGLGEQSWNRM